MSDAIPTPVTLPPSPVPTVVVSSQPAPALVPTVSVAEYLNNHNTYRSYIKAAFVRHEGLDMLAQFPLQDLQTRFNTFMNRTEEE